MKERIHKAVSYSKLKIDWASKEDDLLFQEYGENDTRLNWELYNFLKDKVEPAQYRWLQSLPFFYYSKKSRTNWQNGRTKEFLFQERK